MHAWQQQVTKNKNSPHTFEIRYLPSANFQYPKKMTNFIQQAFAERKISEKMTKIRIVLFLSLNYFGAFSQNQDFNAPTPFEFEKLVDKWIITEINDSLPFSVRLRYEFSQSDSNDHCLVRVIEMIPDSVILSSPTTPLADLDTAMTRLELDFERTYAVTKIHNAVGSIIENLPSEMIYVLYKDVLIKEVIIDRSKLESYWELVGESRNGNLTKNYEFGSVEINESITANHAEDGVAWGYWLDKRTWELFFEMIK